MRYIITVFLVVIVTGIFGQVRFQIVRHDFPSKPRPLFTLKDSHGSYHQEDELKWKCIAADSGSKASGAGIFLRADICPFVVDTTDSIYGGCNLHTSHLEIENRSERAVIFKVIVKVEKGNCSSPKGFKVEKDSIIMEIDDPDEPLRSTGENFKRAGKFHVITGIQVVFVKFLDEKKVAHDPPLEELKFPGDPDTMEQFINKKRKAAFDLIAHQDAIIQKFPDNPFFSEQQQTRDRIKGHLDSAFNNVLQHYRDNHASLEKCWQCMGSGTGTCRTCFGNIGVVCSTCNGSGQLLCPDCHGNGRVTTAGLNHNCMNCTAKGFLTCDLCKGYKRSFCQSWFCGHFGVNYCEFCNGTGFKIKEK